MRAPGVLQGLCLAQADFPPSESHDMGLYVEKCYIGSKLVYSADAVHASQPYRPSLSDTDSAPPPPYAQLGK